MVELDTYDSIAAAQVVVWGVVSFTAIPLLTLSFPSGTGYDARGALSFLAICRIIGSALRLATIATPSNPGHYIAWMVFVHLGGGNMVAVGFGLMIRPLVFIKKGMFLSFVVAKLSQWFLHLCGVAAMILFIVAGVIRTEYQEDDAGNPSIDYSKLWLAAIGLYIPGLAILFLGLVILYRLRSIEKFNIQIAVIGGVSMPFIIVRLLFSGLVIYGKISQSAELYIGMVMVPEVVVGLLVTGLGWVEGIAIIRNSADEEVLNAISFL